MSIGYANICSSVQDHRPKFVIFIRFWKNKREQRNQQKGSLKHLKKSASEVKCSWSDDVIRSKFVRSTSSEARSPKAEVHQEMKDLKLQRLGNWFNHASALQKTKRVLQRPLWENLKALDACSIKCVDKGQLYELYNHYLHYSVHVSTTRQG